MRFFFVMLLCLITSNSMGMTFVDHIRRYYPPLVHKVQEYGLRGPIAMEVAQFALLRQIFEDGMDRSAERSFNGMVPGGINKKVMERLDWSHLKLSTVSANDGQYCYSISGPGANLQSALAIALWYDEIIHDQPSIKDRERELWERSKTCSYLQTTAFVDTRHVMTFLGDEPARLQLLMRVNGLYGPKGHYINQLREQLRPAFIRALN